MPQSGCTISPISVMRFLRGKVKGKLDPLQMKYSLPRNDNKTISCCYMPSKVYSAAVVGVEAFEVEIEVHAGWGNTDKIAVVGLPDTAVKESKDLVTSAICNSGLRWPYGQRITILSGAGGCPQGRAQL